MSRSSYMGAILLFVRPEDVCADADRTPQGDSLTQGCWPGSLYQQLAEAYERKLDVVNRGLSGTFTGRFPAVRSAFVDATCRDRVQYYLVNQRFYPTSRAELLPLRDATGRPHDLTRCHRAVHAFKELFASRQDRDSGLAQPIRLMTIWFGKAMPNLCCSPPVYSARLMLFSRRQRLNTAPQLSTCFR